jgi:hypothetical protein
LRLKQQLVIFQTRTILRKLREEISRLRKAAEYVAVHSVRLDRAGAAAIELENDAKRAELWSVAQILDCTVDALERALLGTETSALSGRTAEHRSALNLYVATHPHATRESITAFLAGFTACAAARSLPAHAQTGSAR